MTNTVLMIVSAVLIFIHLYIFQQERWFFRMNYTMLLLHVESLYSSVSQSMVRVPPGYGNSLVGVRVAGVFGGDMHCTNSTFS